MNMEHIKPSTMSTICAILYSPPHLPMMFIDRRIREGIWISGLFVAVLWF